MIDQEWTMDSIVQLSTVVNLSNLQKMYLLFGHQCDFAKVLDVKMNVIFKQAWNLRSIRIGRIFSTEKSSITRNLINLRLPSHIKQLDVEIKHLDDAKIMLKQYEHLSQVTLRPPDDNYRIAGEIIRWLKNMKRDSQFTIDYGNSGCCALCDWVDGVHLWLERIGNKQSNILSSCKRFKLTYS
ncbi:unnamed protein product [Rotaria socialis]|uniref:Uncharacterized protein n=2 Tax=Rotaria TaxID=231623 RepID=A0A816XF46_9BILA|nr:unnamed protein product [Rotaria magnacalcarata]CAF3243305.1 unnamed protein product [Rotaria socialis]CAF1616642.1 unnamed protein product [Rotaria magnacalcarata]CAF2112258.1 unnamed protein product [Rotaria magnacalcarata]CAF2141951.1 unnamed protein product [Rotaria magnacalcarata]